MLMIRVKVDKKEQGSEWQGELGAPQGDKILEF